MRVGGRLLLTERVVVLLDRESAECLKEHHIEGVEVSGGAVEIHSETNILNLKNALRECIKNRSEVEEIYSSAVEVLFI